jgi:hypothetical protein
MASARQQAGRRPRIGRRLQGKQDLIRSGKRNLTHWEPTLLFYRGRIALLDVIPLARSAAAMRSSARLWIWETRLSRLARRSAV